MKKICGMFALPPIKTEIYATKVSQAYEKESLRSNHGFVQIVIFFQEFCIFYIVFFILSSLMLRQKDF